MSTTHRLATELAEWQVLERCDDRRFRPGLSLRTLGGSSCCTTSMRDRAAPVLEDLSRATGANTRLGLLDELSVNYIYKAGLSARLPVLTGRHPSIARDGNGKGVVGIRPHELS